MIQTPCQELYNMSASNLSSQTKQTETHTSVNMSNQRAQLNAMGIEVYEPIEQIMLSEESWIEDLCGLLSIPLSNVIYDVSQAKFDEETKTLHLPASSYETQAQVKKLIWRNVRQFVG
jgi:hypothetical protein